MIGDGTEPSRAAGLVWWAAALLDAAGLTPETGGSE